MSARRFHSRKQERKNIEKKHACPFTGIEALFQKAVAGATLEGENRHLLHDTYLRDNTIDITILEFVAYLQCNITIYQLIIIGTGLLPEWLFFPSDQSRYYSKKSPKKQLFPF